VARRQPKEAARALCAERVGSLCAGDRFDDHGYRETVFLGDEYADSFGSAKSEVDTTRSKNTPMWSSVVEDFL
jgi:hypothetical protein